MDNAVIKDFDITKEAKKVRGHDLQAHISIWLPSDYKDKYDEIQARSGRGFSKYLRDLIKVAIDRVNLDEKPKS